MADKVVLVYNLALNVPDEGTSADRMKFPGGFVNAGAAGDMGAQKLTNLGDAAVAGDALAFGQTGAVLTGLGLGAGKLTGLADGTVGTDGVTKAQLDAVASGFGANIAVRLKSSTSKSAWIGGGTAGPGHTLTSPDNLAVNNTFDSVVAAVGDRILISQAGGDDVTADPNNGVYDVTQLANGTTLPTILTRVTDFDQAVTGEVEEGACFFVDEGTIYGGNVWCQITLAPIVMETTGLLFAQIGATPNVVFGAGLVDGANVSVELDTAANAQGVGTGGGSSGLEFDAAGDAGLLRAKVDPAGGIQRNAAGLGVEIDITPDTLKADAAGLGVTGLPSLFKVNDVAVGATVTAANLDTLSNGGNADALHIHAAMLATEAPKVENDYLALAAVNAGDPVHFSANDQVSKSDAINLSGVAAQVFGLARTAAAAAASVPVVTSGPLPAVLTGAAFGDDVFLQTGGGLTTGTPTGPGRRRLIRVGYAINATDLFVQINDEGIRATA